MRIYCVIVLAIGLAFIVDADETNVPTNPIIRQYDHALYDKILDHWFKILDAMPFKTQPPTGNVVCEFHLLPDGHISDLKVLNPTVEESLVAPCKKAIFESAPFATWTREMHQEYTNGFCVIKIKFYYK
jgi:hypothetical protein